MFGFCEIRKCKKLFGVESTVSVTVILHSLCVTDTMKCICMSKSGKPGIFYSEYFKNYVSLSNGPVMEKSLVSGVGKEKGM